MASSHGQTHLTESFPLAFPFVHDKINGRQITDSKQRFEKEQVDQETGAFKVQYGKKKIVLLKPT